MSGHVREPPRSSSTGLDKRYKQSRSGVKLSESYGNLAAGGGCSCHCGCKSRDRSSVGQLESQYLRNLQQQIYFLELENSYLKGEVRTTAEVVRPKLVGETEGLLHRLRHSRRHQEKTDAQLRERHDDVEQISRERELLLGRLQAAEETHAREKRALSDEAIELRKRLDDCQPELARRQAHIGQLETRLHEALGKLRAADQLCVTLKHQIEQRSREEVAVSTMEAERRSEVEQLTRNIRSLESGLTEHISKETTLNDELSALKRSVREAELHARKEKELGQKIVEENDALIKENSELTAQLSSLQSNVTTTVISYGNEQHVLSELSQSRETEKDLRSQLLRLQDALANEQLQTKQLAARMRDQESAFEGAQSSSTTLQKELDTLESLSRALSAENQDLRKEKVSLMMKLDELTSILSHKDLEQQTAKERLLAIEQQYKKLLRHYEHEAVLQDEKSREFEQLAERVKDLSRTLRHVNLPPNGTSVSPETAYSEDP